MNYTQRREAFRALLEGARCVHPASVHDPLTARIAEDLGYECGILGGSVASLTVLGVPDLVVLTLTELAGLTRRITRAAALPLMVDADHGFGNALSVMRSVAELESAGTAALTIEDTALPREYGRSAERLTGIDEAAAKMRAALEARTDAALVIIGRTDLRRTDATDAAARLAAYAAAGVDALMAIGVKTRGALEELRASAPGLPMVLGGAGAELADTAFLAGQGVRIALQGHRPFAAAVQAAYETMRALREGAPPAEAGNVASQDLMDRLTRSERFADYTRRFLR